MFKLTHRQHAFVCLIHNKEIPKQKRFTHCSVSNFKFFERNYVKIQCANVKSWSFFVSNCSMNEVPKPGKFLLINEH